jgi:hypothetical protein
MNSRLAGLVFCSALAFTIRSIGPADASLAVYVFGGEDCNHSDTVMHDCVEINGRTTSCGLVAIGADSVQACRDMLVDSTTICTDNNCQNETKDKKKPPGCNKVGCDS